MARSDKLVARFLDRPNDFTWSEVVRLLQGFGYSEAPRGKTSGSRRRFARPNGRAITLHKPHPGNVVRTYVLDDLRRILSEENLL